MSVVDDLLEQSMHLSTLDPRRPKQANLRRAVSSAYYALFHTVTERAITAMLSGTDAAGPIGLRMRRVVQHRAAQRAAKWFVPGRPQLPAQIEAMRTTNSAVEPRLEKICQHFVELYQERERADYDLGSPFDRADVKRLVTDAAAAVRELRGLALGGDTLIFLLGCVLGESLTRNS